MASPALVEAERKRGLEAAAKEVEVMSADNVWQLEYDDMPDEGFVDGLRISTDCAARRVIEPLDPDRYHEFPEHLGKRGHGFERVMQEWLRKVHGIESVRETVIPWEYGETHLDLLLMHPEPLFDTGGKPLFIELKANKDAQVRSENIRQVQRQMYVAERAVENGRNVRHPHFNPEDGSWSWRRLDLAVLRNAEWRVIVIDPTTWRVPDPNGVRVTISDERRLELDKEWAAMRAFMELPESQLRWAIEFPEKMSAIDLPCTCGKCFRPTLEALDDTLVENAAMYLSAQEEAGVALAEQNHHRDFLLSQLVRHCDDAAGASWVGGGFKVTVSKPSVKGTRSVRVSKSDAKVTPQL